MRVHRTRHTAGSTVLPNFRLRDRRPSFTARGPPSHLLSHPENIRQDIETLAAGDPKGRVAIARAVREPIAHGYLTREHVRNASGRSSTVVNVYDTPQDGRRLPPCRRRRSRARRPRTARRCAVPAGKGCPGAEAGTFRSPEGRGVYASAALSHALIPDSAPGP